MSTPKSGTSTVSDPRPAETIDVSSDSTVQILDRAREGDLAAAEALIARISPSVRRWARGRVPAQVRHDANTEDVVQDVMLNVLKRLKRVRYGTVGGFQAYLRTSVVNRIRDLIRGSKRRGIPVEFAEALQDAAPSPLETAIMRQGLESFIAGLQRLRPAERQLIIWRFELGYTVNEIASMLGKSPTAAAMSVSRATQRLAAELKMPAAKNRSGT
jgi:RNA polymerase sigma-70 factor (ECF subfamily)